MMAVTKEEIIEAISNMTVLELAELVKALEEKFGVTAAPAVAVGAVPAAAAAPAEEEEKEEKTLFELVLKEVGGKKVQVIKTLREVLPNLGLKEAKEFVENLPKTVKSNLTKEEAEELKKKFEAVGAKVEIK